MKHTFTARVLRLPFDATDLELGLEELWLLPGSRWSVVVRHFRAVSMNTGPDIMFIFRRRNFCAAVTIQNMSARVLFIYLAIVCGVSLASNVLVLDDNNFWDHVGGVDGVMVEFYARTHRRSAF